MRLSQMKDKEGSVVDTAPVLAPGERIWSDEQQAIGHEFEHGTGNFVVYAFAGTGKTTTIEYGVLRAPESDILVTTFTNKMTRELKDRFADSQVIVQSLHALGRQDVVRTWKRAQVNEDRARTLTNAVCPPKVVDSARRIISRIHTKGRELKPYASCGADLINIALMEDLTHPEVDIDTLCDYAYKAMEAALEPGVMIDFADMLYLPIRLGLVRPRYDLVVVDEAQDMSEVQLELALAALRPGGRFVAVGDEKQAIFGWRGADVQALSRLKGELDAKAFTLSTSYRCGTEIIKAAQTLVPGIQAAPNAHAGKVLFAHPSEIFDIVEPGNFILSRTNAPLVRTAMSLLRRNRRTKIEGRDIGKQLTSLVKRAAKWGSITSVEQMLANLEDWAAREIRRAEKADVPARVEMVMDQMATISTLAEGAEDVDEVESRIDYLFDDEVGDDYIICSTVHRAKGLEADRVLVLRDTLSPPVRCECGHRHRHGVVPCHKCDCTQYVRDEQAAQEELNIIYVAITRAKDELVWLTTDVPERQEL